ncbi:hypothetical protein BCR36DRAFT_341782 [Piromyces finnis]|uniref:Chitin-binding type-1 domain-containing protein n=1 Tax=Piromyces finnis TaxID=1754191 RepID=A0A1Y1VPS3_9FUNG|nr:hypothetical protein BCR36DRAFT_341782 [Piromyces finnis]|eukprot:ORX61250.1 hypothetical protein BCR36DRAFT_341782 [Piromyces finnis]
MFIYNLLSFLFLLISFVCGQEQKELNFDSTIINQNFIDNISKNIDLEKLNIYKSNFTANVNYKPLENLNKLTSITILQSTNVDFNILKELKSLKFITISDVTLNQNEINIINDLVDLELLSLERTQYGSNVDFESFKNFNKVIKLETTVSSETTSKNVIIKSNRCGKGYGQCPSGQCCSKYGWCGKSSTYCSFSKGCQLEFGQCQIYSQQKSQDNNQQNSQAIKCGMGYGNCPTGFCCSRYGWCGKSSSYCSVSKGCQSKFGQCQINSQESTQMKRCGKEFGSCPSHQCCSKFGWCGKSTSYCLISRGCQSEFGQCY